ncbi:MAG: hypothetical protein EBQ92_06420 [Proteobacteria bacterium]|nr:hypothetical protein [Pseudomonadota bacterium]
MKKLFWVITLLSVGVLFSKNASAENKCSDYQQSMCIQMVAPVWCVSLSVGGEVLRKPLYAKGSNACVAMNQLRKKACDKGLDWKDLADEEVHCVMLKY